MFSPSVEDENAPFDYPFSIIGSNQEILVDGQKVRGRKYGWGVSLVENEAHCDFKKLRSLLVRFVVEIVVEIV